MGQELMTVVPSRMSVGDDTFDPSIGHRLCIEIGGLRQEQVVAYDVEAGWIDRVVLDIDGKAVFDRKGEAVATERVTGTVVVILLPEGGGSKV